MSNSSLITPTFQRKQISGKDMQCSNSNYDELCEVNIFIEVIEYSSIQLPMSTESFKKLQAQYYELRADNDRLEKSLLEVVYLREMFLKRKIT